MTEASREERTSTSGGSMVRLAGPPRGIVPDLGLLEPERRRAHADPVRPAGGAPYFGPGDEMTWHYGLSADTLRVVRDDARGLVAWLPSGSEQLVSVPVDGRALRDRPLAERFTADRMFRVRRWQGPGILRVAPTGCPWSVWYFFDDTGAFGGHYVNLELTHERPVDGSPRVHTRDLVLDLWLENGETWLKDADELEAAVRAGRYAAEQADVVRAVADLARRELIEPRAWPLDEEWETWRPPAAWDEPLALPDQAVAGVEIAPGRPT